MWLRDVYRRQKEHESALTELERLRATITYHADLAADRPFGRFEALALAFDASSESIIDREIPGAPDQTGLAPVDHNFQFVGVDGSRGVHNPALARRPLDLAEEIITDQTDQ